MNQRFDWLGEEPLSTSVDRLGPLPGVAEPAPDAAHPHRRDWRPLLAASVTQTWNEVAQGGSLAAVRLLPHAVLFRGDALEWLATVPPSSLHAIVTDPPYGLIEYDDDNHGKLRGGRGGVWRIPPTLDGATRRPLPRFTVLTPDDRTRLASFFGRFAAQAARVLVPGGHLLMASNPLLSTSAFGSVEAAGLEKRGEIIRVVQTLRGGDRPKGAEEEFADVTVMPRSCWEPWGLFRKPLSERTVAANLRRWGTGGLRRTSGSEPFKDLIESSPTNRKEREIADHPSLKPQKFLRQVVRAVLPVGLGIIADPFAGSGSTLAAAARLGYQAVGTETDAAYFEMARRAVPALAGVS